MTNKYKILIAFLALFATTFLTTQSAMAQYASGGSVTNPISIDKKVKPLNTADGLGAHGYPQLGQSCCPVTLIVSIYITPIRAAFLKH